MTATKNTIIEPRSAAGTLELLPREQIAFQRMLQVIQSTYERYGFLPIETPVFELTDVLLNKSGGDTEKQVFFASKTGSLEKDRELNRRPELALRFDLTVPMARYVAEHEHQLTFPFRRYQIQRSYRGERPQRGRMNEFYQCDIDIVGKDTLSPTYDAELPAIVCDIFKQLNLGDFTIHFSNRKIMLGVLEAHSISADVQTLALRELDKLDKISAEKVHENMMAVGIPAALGAQLLQLVQPEASNDAVLKKISTLASSPTLAEGYKELQTMCTALAAQGVPEKNARLNLGIIRGLDYYTGTVYETKMDAHPEFGTVCGGGRYENLAGLYTKSHLPGVGLSIGATRLFDQFRALGHFDGTTTTTAVLVTIMEDAYLTDYLGMAQSLRRAGIATEVFFEGGKMAKQVKYADRAGIPLVVIMGPDEKAKGTVSIKNMSTGAAHECAIADLVRDVQAQLSALTSGQGSR